MSKKKILVVDDEAVIRNVLDEALTIRGYEVVQAEDGVAGFEVFQNQSPDLVISDIYMPRMNGIHLLRAIRREQPSARVVLVTSYAHFRQLTEDAKSHPNGFFEKPFMLTTLINQVEQLIGAP